MLGKNNTIKDMPFALRPREKFKKYGSSALLNDELLAIILGSGVEGKSVAEISKSIIKKYASNLVNASYKELMKEKGIGEVKAMLLECSFELAKRMLVTDTTKKQITSPKDLEADLQEYKNLKKEHLIAFYLSPTNHLLFKEVISIGTVDSSLIHPREIIAPALEHRATAIVLAHNHPFGDSNPSEKDITITKAIDEACKLMGISLIDHLVISNEGLFSLRESFITKQKYKSLDDDFYVRQGAVQRSLFDFYEIDKKIAENNKNLKFIDLFCGIGGFHSAIKEATKGKKLNCQCVFSCDIDTYAQKTYYHNYNILPAGDITKIDEKTIPKHDILFAGFPCQAFSVAGYRKGFEDTRGTLFFDIARIMKFHQPKFAILENVKGLVGHDKGNTLKIILQVLQEELNYFVQYKVLNTSEYSNIPQNRERIYIVASKEKLSDIFPKKQKLLKSIHDIIENKKQDSIYYYNNHKYYEKLSAEITRTDTIYQWRRHYVRENKSSLCPTLTANMGTGGHNVPLIKDAFGIRKLTPKECLKFQGFNDSFNFPDIPRSQQYKQIGNSISIPVVTQIILNILKVTKSEL